MYQNIIGINDNLDNLICTMDSIIFDPEKTEIKKMDWYFIMIIICIEFIMIYFNSSSKVQIGLMNQLSKIISLQNMGKEEEDKIKAKTMKILYEPILKFYHQEKMTKSILEEEHFLNKNIFYLKYITHMLNAFLNIKKISLLNKNNLNNNYYYIIFFNLFLDTFSKRIIKSIKKDPAYIQIIKNNINCFPEEISLLKQLFPFLKQEQLISKNELLMDELIDYHGQYHCLMKELFNFNRLWSNQELFYNDSLNKRKEANIKYKNANYYTRNFQRPIIYPILDYKYRYPDFYSFKIKSNFYISKEEKDDYNFDFDSPELDKLVEEYDNKIFEEIEKIGKINTYYVCLIKQLYHVKGKLFIICEGDKLIMYFYSFPDDIQNEKDNMNCCNKKMDDSNNNNYTYYRDYKNFLCYGALFKCPKREQNRIIKIKLKDVRMILKRIYYYRKSAIEIFTETKSYYFNFASESKVYELFILLIYPCESSYFPININNHTIGYIKVNRIIFEENNLTELINKKNDFIEYISNKTSMGELFEMSIFDIIMLINLISNRSYNDLHQYPIFPTLYFIDKNNNNSNNSKFSITRRDLKEQIGYQEMNEGQKERKKLILFAYNSSNDEMFGNTNNLSLENKRLFNTHYSNIVYASNFMVRLFPYSFSAIEMQGSGFDNPNRLFHYIQDTFYNMGTQKSDLRELIPEFYYLPEMFMNVNYINFSRRSNGELVDDVIMPDIMSERNNFNKLKDKSNYEKIFIFIDDLKTQLEYLEQDLSSWINLIFGTNQRFDNKKRQYFRYESYINVEGEDYEKYLKDDVIMNSCDFGIMPLQTIFKSKILENFKNRKNTYENIEGIINEVDSQINKESNQLINNKIQKSLSNKSDSDDKNKGRQSENLTDENIMQKQVIPNSNNKINQNDNLNNINQNDNTETNIKKPKYVKKYQMSEKYFIEDYWDKKAKIDFKINNNYNIGKLEIYKRKIIRTEIMDHSDKITDFFYNRRLNMFATCSLDGLACIYILPNKLFSAIKNPNNSYFNRIILSSNPFPSIITFEKNKNILSSYSLSGLLIKQIIVETQINVEIDISPILNIYGGNIKDQIKVSIITNKNITNQIYSLPLFDQESEELIDNNKN